MLKRRKEKKCRFQKPLGGYAFAHTCSSPFGDQMPRRNTSAMQEKHTSTLPRAATSGGRCTKNIAFTERRVALGMNARVGGSPKCEQKARKQQGQAGECHSELQHHLSASLIIPAIILIILVKCGHGRAASAAAACTCCHARFADHRKAPDHAGGFVPVRAAARAANMLAENGA